MAAPPPPPDQTLRLPDGRTLAWCEYGVPDGTPALYVHGIPGSRIDSRVISGAIDGAGLRLIAPDRPGFGLSDAAVGKRTYAGWAHDVKHLIGALGVGRLGIVAYSAGSPYALATAMTLPDQVTKVAIVSGVAPSEMPGFRKETGPTDRLMTRLVPTLPWLARGLLRLSIATARKRPERFEKQLNRDFPAAPDQQVLDSGLRPILVQLFAESTRNGTAGILEDFAVWARPSGLALDRVDAPVNLWHGGLDGTIPVAHSRWLASQLPSADLTVWPGAGHLHTDERWSEVLSTLR